MPFVPNFCHVFYNGWTISTPNFSPKATSNHELWRTIICHLSQTSVMCSIMVGLSPHQISAPRLLVIMSYGELKYMPIIPIFYQRDGCTKFQHIGYQ